MPLTASLIGYWKLDEASGNALDSHGSNPLTDNNTVGTGTGKIGNARDFEVANLEYFSHADNSDLSTGDIDFSLQAWIKFESLPGNGSTHQVILGRWASSTQKEYLLFMNAGAGANGRIDFIVSSDGATNSATVSDSTTLATGVWYHVIVWHSASANEIGIWVNGAVTTTSHSGGVFNSTSALEVGRLEDGATWHFDGLIDDVGFWKKVLTSDERANLYYGGYGYSYANILAWGTIANDTFTGANGTNLDAHTPDSGGSWARIGTGDIEIQSNSLYNQSVNSQFALLSASANAKQAVEVTVAARNGYPLVWLLGGISGADATGYYVYVNASFGTALREFTGSGVGHTEIATNATAFADGDILRVEYEPSTDTFTIFKNGSSVWTHIDSTYTSGGVGVGSLSVGTAADNWRAHEGPGAGTADGTFSASGTSTPSLVGASSASGVFSASGTCTPTLTGAAAASGIAGFSGASSVALTGASSASGEGSFSAAGSSLVALAGASSAAGALAAGGTSSVAFAGNAIFIGTFTAAGACSVSFAGASSSSGDGTFSSAGTCNLSLAGASVSAGALAIVGTGTFLVTGGGGAAVTETIHPRIKAAAMAAILELDLAGSGIFGGIEDRVYSQLLPDETGLLFPCVILSTEGERERPLPGDSECERWQYPVRIWIADRQSARCHEKESLYMTWRKQIMRRFHNQPLETDLENVVVPEAEGCLIEPDVIFDEKLPQYQHMISSMLLLVSATEAR